MAADRRQRARPGAADCPARDAPRSDADDPLRIPVPRPVQQAHAALVRHQAGDRRAVERRRHLAARSSASCRRHRGQHQRSPRRRARARAAAAGRGPPGSPATSRRSASHARRRPGAGVGDVAQRQPRRAARRAGAQHQRDGEGAPSAARRPAAPATARHRRRAAPAGSASPPRPPPPAGRRRSWRRASTELVEGAVRAGRCASSRPAHCARSCGTAVGEIGAPADVRAPRDRRRRSRRRRCRGEHGRQRGAVAASRCRLGRGGQRQPDRQPGAAPLGRRQQRRRQRDLGRGT